VMLGRHAYHEPWAMAAWDQRFWCATAATRSREEVEARFVDYMVALQNAGTPWGHASRHMLGLRNGQAGARRWRQVWSDPTFKSGPPQVAQQQAWSAMANAAASAVQNSISTHPPLQLEKLF
jgi:tRNA-dihydrouridine synthase A